MPTPTGPSTNRPQKFVVAELELQKRARLNAEVAAELSRPLIAHDLLSAAEREEIARHRGSKAYAPAAATRSAKGWRLPPGVSREYRAGTSRDTTAPSPQRHERRIVNGWPAMTNNKVRDHLGEAGFGYWQGKGVTAHFCGKFAGDMTRDELLAAFGWVLHGYGAWRHAYLIRTDRRYKAGFGATAKRVTQEIKDDAKPLPSQWLGANEKMLSVVGSCRDSREAR